MTDPEREHWESLYCAALLELDREKLLPSLGAAEQAIQQRLLSLRHDPDHHAERQAIEDALQNLRVLRHMEFPEEQS
ncbi:MAG TPA: hypothetical protein VMT53_14480 [Terriglobales bacterium]|nr:hypothetical protein [Terriglobales bacterium]